MTVNTDHLVRLMCAAETVHDYGYVHTGRAFDRMISAEQQRLKLAYSKDALPRADTRPRCDYAPEDT